MVKIGDKIETEFGEKGTITNIKESSDGRYLIVYEAIKCDDEIQATINTFYEGDILFKVVEK